MEQADFNRDNIQDLLPYYLLSIYPGSKMIYQICLCLVIISLVCIPLVSVQVSVSGRGIIRPVQEKTRIVASASGIVADVYVEEGNLVLKSEPLLEVRSADTEDDLLSLQKERKETEIHIKDLQGLTSNPPKIPLSAEYSREYDDFIKKTEYLGLLQSKARRELSRHEGLYKNGLISEKDYDDLVFEFDKATKALENHKYRSIKNWQNECYNLLVRQRDLESRIRKTEEQIHLTTVYAPASGHMVEFNGILKGSVIQAGSVIGILSPESELIGEFYVPSRNIAYLRKDQKVQIHLDAYTTREWGFIPALIYEISSDILVVENQPVYRVKCRPERTELFLKNGYSASLKKGMTFQARCLVTRRTLFQLLTDKADKWLNPALQARETTPLP
jgi:HlyD family secretion protein